MRVVTGDTSFFQFRKGKDRAHIALISLFSNIVDLGKYQDIYGGSGEGALEQLASRARDQNPSLRIATAKGAKSRSLERFPEIGFGSRS